MQFPNLLLVVAPTLFLANLAPLVDAAPTRGPLITVPGNFTAVSHQSQEYKSLVDGLRKAQATGNTTELGDSTRSNSTASTGGGSSISTSTKLSTPEGGRDSSTAGMYGKSANSTTASLTQGAQANATTTEGGNSTASTSQPPSTQGKGDVTVITWLPMQSSAKGDAMTCSVSIKTNGANGTEISTVGVPSANVTNPPHKTAANGGSDESSGITRTRCSTVTSINRGREAKYQALVDKKAKQLKQNRLKPNKKVLASQNNTVPVVFHVITDGSKGELSDGDIAKQIDVLNTDYKEHGFAFRLTNTSRVDNGTWFSNANYGSDAVYEMKTTLRQGGADTLNIYTVDFSDGTLGFATFPWDYEDSPREDGIVIQYSTLPGGSETGYNGGRTATHETGHFLGLYHTFMSGCTSPGDFVNDTPPQASPTSGCPAKRDSCPGDDLDDPIHNFMDYSTDDCLTDFTAGQTLRMQAMFSSYRSGQAS